MGATAGEEARMIALCDTQPLMVEGVRTLLGSTSDLELRETVDSLAKALEMVRRVHPSAILIDKAFGAQAIVDWLTTLRPAETCPHTGIIIWGTSVAESEALRFLQAGARGILRKTAAAPVVLSCLRTVAEGRTWMEDSVFRESGLGDRYSRSELTQRERQVLELVEQGMRNKEIAGELGIRPGTVKIHLKHIFEKTGVRGRYGLALNNMRQREQLSA